VVLGGQDEVEQEELSDHVGDVDEFGDDEQRRQVVALPVNM